jgi:hypothetical protein
MTVSNIEVELCVLVGELRHPSEAGPGVADHDGSRDVELVRFSGLREWSPLPALAAWSFPSILNGSRGFYPAT